MPGVPCRGACIHPQCQYVGLFEVLCDSDLVDKILNLARKLVLISCTCEGWRSPVVSVLTRQRLLYLRQVLIRESRSGGQSQPVPACSVRFGSRQATFFVYNRERANLSDRQWICNVTSVMLGSG